KLSLTYLRLSKGAQSMSTPTNFTHDTPLFAVLADPRGRAVVANALPDLVGSAILHTLHGYPVGLIARTEDSLDDDAKASLLADITAIALRVAAPAPPAGRYTAPRADYDDAPRGSARWSSTDEVAAYGRFELVLDGPSHGNPFVDVVLDARIEGPGV